MREKRTFSRGERGAAAVMVAILLVVLFGAAAVAYDLSNLMYRRQGLQNRMDSAAHAGAAALPDRPVEAARAAEVMAKGDNADLKPVIDLFCVVGSTGKTRQVLAGQIPNVCDPGKDNLAKAICDERTCTIPCPTDNKYRCNTARVSAREDVPFSIAPVIGMSKGDTGVVTSVACNGSCGEVLPNSMDVVVVADRTLSMPEPDLDAMKDGIKAMLQTMTPEHQYVALGTIHRGDASNPCVISRYEDRGPWVVSQFSNNYLGAGQSGSRPLNSSSDLVRKVGCIERPVGLGYSYGTHLAAAMKGAADALRNPSAVSHLPKQPGNVQKVIIFETDGVPDETMGSAPANSANPAGGPQWLRPWAEQTYERSSGGVEGCKRLVEVAEQAKKDGILVITIGYGDAATQKCNLLERRPVITDGDSRDYAKRYLADAASPGLDGNPSTAGDCSTRAGREAENKDGDFFFCAATAKELAPIFESAISQVRKGIRFIELTK